MPKCLLDVGGNDPETVIPVHLLAVFRTLQDAADHVFSPHFLAES